MPVQSVHLVDSTNTTDVLFEQSCDHSVMWSILIETNNKPCDAFKLSLFPSSSGAHTHTTSGSELLVGILPFDTQQAESAMLYPKQVFNVRG
ncbi:hypothetical protein Bpfe_009475 [Biomphalaria pfeifferi]|uniref:Uncharacterized protein n=1 Tax=Biomphalaria pfeifferi TaxID=112525 RepID=A0AAD8FDH4_BIOPF|nr:hypothetical protein Bpfe_009475 [Biomphalaria pfeifferi]